MRALWHYREFIIRFGWQDWQLKEVEVIDETQLCWKIAYRILGIIPWVKWIPKDSLSDKIEVIKERTDVQPS